MLTEYFLQAPHDLCYIVGMNSDYFFYHNVWQVLQQCRTPRQDNRHRNQNIMLWQQPEFLNAINQTENAKKSMAVLRKHLPKQYHELIRFAQPKTIWYLNVEKGLTATRLNMLLDDLSLKIAKDIGYAPKIRVMVQAGKWHHSGFPLEYITSHSRQLPTEEEADHILADFLKSSPTQP